jgi:hypothetical protein
LKRFGKVDARASSNTRRAGATGLDSPPVMHARALACVALVLALAAATIEWGGEGGRATAYHQVITWGLALAAALLGRLLLGKVPPGSWRWQADAARVVPWSAGWILLDVGTIAAGYLLGWATFTYGDQSLEAGKLWLPLWALPLALAAGLAAERGLRAGLWRALAAAGSPRSATLASVAGGVALALPAILPRWQVADPGYVAAAVAAAAAREAALVAVYRRGGLILAGGARGILLFVDAFGINDWYAAWFPAAQYVSSEPAFYRLRAGGAALGAALLVLGLRRRRARSGG